MPLPLRHEILGFIAKDNPEAASRLAESLEAGILRLLDFPHIAPIVPAGSGVRQLIIPPCRILYRATHEEVLVLGVMRCEQDLGDALPPG